MSTKFQSNGHCPVDVVMQETRERSPYRLMVFDMAALSSFALLYSSTTSVPLFAAPQVPSSRSNYADFCVSKLSSIGRQSPGIWTYNANGY
jgi:hypothetical protein